MIPIAGLRLSHPDERAVVEDYERSHGRPFRVQLPPYGDGGDGGYGDGGGYGGYGDGGGYDGGYGDGGDGYGDGDGGDGGQKPWKEPIMKEGLAIIVSPGGYSPYVRIGWLRRVEGDEWEIHGARVIRRFGHRQELATMARKGPARDTELLRAAEVPSPIHRLHAIRIEPADAAAWAEHCPNPWAPVAKSR